MLRRAFGIISCLLLTGCASTYSQPTNTHDPLEPYNRAMFRFNSDFNNAFLKPISQGYTNVVPRPARNSVHNFFTNIMTVPDILNDALQFNFHYMFSDIARLIINTTLGVGGLFDVAAQNHIYAHEQSFGLTFEKWGFKNSPYFITPVLGPSNVANATGMLPYYYANPVGYVKPYALRYGMTGLETIQLSSEFLPQQEALAAMSIDPYVALRTAYLQNHAYVLTLIENDGNPPPPEDEISS